MLEYDKLIDIIITIKENLNEDFDSLLEKYKVYIEENKLKIKDLEFLYNVIKNYQDLDNEFIINFLLESNNKVERNIILSTITTNDIVFKRDEELYLNNFLCLITRYGRIEIIPKNIEVIWNQKENTDDIEFNSLTSTKQVEIIYKSYDSLEKQINNIKNENQLLKFDNFNRIIGIPVSIRGYRLNYFLRLKIDENLFIVYNVYDNVANPMVNIKVDNIYKENISINDINRIIEIFSDKIIEKLLLFSEENFYFRIFSMYKPLNHKIFKLLKSYNLYNANKIKYENLFEVELDNKFVLLDKKMDYCEHEEEYEKLFILDEKYYERMNIFLEKYIKYESNLPICKICGTHLSLFNIVENTYIQRRGEIVITTSKENVFSYIEKKYVGSQSFFINVITSFDNMFKTNKYVDINEIVLLTIDFLILMENNRITFEQLFRKEINENNLFILRFNKSFFDISADKKEMYYEKKLFNMHVIVSFVIVLNLSLNELFSIITSKKIKLLEKNNTDIINILSNIIFKFLKKLKIIDILIQKNTNEEKNMKIKILEDIEIILYIYIKILEKDKKNKNQLYNIENLYDKYIILKDKFFKNFFELKNNRNNSIIIYNNIPTKIFDEFKLRLLPLNFNDNFIIKNLNIDKEYKLDLNIKDKIIDIKETMINSSYDENFDNYLSKFKYKYFYNDKELNEIKQINKDSFYIKIGNNYKILSIDNNLETTNISSKVNSVFALFNFGNPCSYLNNIKKNHLITILNGFQSMLSIFFPNYRLSENFYIEKDFEIKKELLYFIMYNILNEITDIESWIKKNKDYIKREYYIEEEKFLFKL